MRDRRGVADARAPEGASPSVRYTVIMRPGPMVRSVLDHLPLALFLLALAIGLIAYGIAIERYGLFPKSIIDAAAKTARTTAENLARPDIGRFREFSDTPLDDFAAARIDIVGGGGTPSLVFGGRHQFRDLCPEHGCLAVAVDASGEVVHAWPFRPNAIHAANIVDEDDYPRELNAFSLERNMALARIEQYPNGDLLATFHLKNAFPYAGGIARIDREGYPRWFRNDYSHHAPLLTEGDIAWVPSYTIGDGAASHSCDGKVYRTTLSVLDGDGALLMQIPVLDTLLVAGVVTLSSCDPLHLNSVAIVGEDANGGIDAGDLVLSLRNINAFAILDGDTHDFKRLVRGGFLQQHDVIHLSGSSFLMFDNQGGERSIGASRLLMVDIAANAETTIFPNERTPEALRGLYSAQGGAIDVSPDRKRAIVTVRERSAAVEVRLADGEVLTVYRSLHDVSDLGQFPRERIEVAAYFGLLGVSFLHDGQFPRLHERIADQ